MFTTPCFIRKNTPELRKKLEELGYVNGGKERTYGEHDSLYCTCYFRRYFECVQKPSRYESIIDCGTNEELFLALASLRDDSPINSYYWFKDKLVLCYNVFDLNINQNITYRFQSVDNPKICFSSNIDIMRKATVEEIIEHFGNIKIKK